MAESRAELSTSSSDEDLYALSEAEIEDADVLSEADSESAAGRGLEPYQKEPRRKKAEDADAGVAEAERLQVIRVGGNDWQVQSCSTWQVISW